MLYNSRWFFSGRVAGGGKPSDVTDVEELVRLGIRAVVSLEVISDPIADALASRGIAHHELLVDMSGHDEDEVILPSDADLAAAWEFIRVALQRGQAVYVHCNAGIRRTPFFIRLLAERFPLAGP